MLAADTVRDLVSLQLRGFLQCGAAVSASAPVHTGNICGRHSDRKLPANKRFGKVSLKL